MFVGEQILFSGKTEFPSRVFRLDPEHPDELRDSLVAVEIDGCTRKLSAAVLRMMDIFNEDQLGRAELGHDCGVFARACFTGNTYEGVQFYGRDGMPNNLRVSDGVDVNRADELESQLSLGDALCTKLNDMHGNQIMNAHHIMVRVSADGHEPLYASRFSAASGGPVFVHTLKESLNYYPAHSVHKVIGWVGDH